MIGLTPEEWVAIRLSLRVAFWATLVSLPFGVAVAMLLAIHFWCVRKDGGISGPL